MDSLNRLLRRGVSKGGGYLPFTQPPYQGRFNPWAPARQRAAGASSNNLVAASLNKLSRPRPRSTYYLYEDRRLWHPEGANAFPRSKRETYPRMVDRSPWAGPFIGPEPEPFFPPRKPKVPYRGPLKEPRGHDFFPGDSLDRRLNITRLSPLSWENPYDMLICLKRKMRREVMHALGIAGSHKIRKPRYTQFSFVRCR